MTNTGAPTRTDLTALAALRAVAARPVRNEGLARTEFLNERMAHYRFFFCLTEAEVHARALEDMRVQF